MSLFQIRIIFLIAALYDISIGLACVVAGPSVFEWAGLPAPNPLGGFQFGALLLMIFGMMFATVVVDPVGQRNLIRYGLLRKLGCCLLIGYYWVNFGVPTILKPYFVIDAVMYGLFLALYLNLGKKTRV